MDETEQKLGKNFEKYLNVVYRDVFNLTLAEEDEKEFTINNNYGDSVSEDENVRLDFLFGKELMGFEEVERANYQRKVYKLSEDIKGEWLKLVRYQNWILRVIEETTDKYLLICNSSDAEIIGFNKLKGLTIMYKWVNKSDTNKI